jgi:hypothetical protein
MLPTCDRSRVLNLESDFIRPEIDDVEVKARRAQYPGFYVLSKALRFNIGDTDKEFL